MLVEGFSGLELVYRGHQSCIYKATRDSDQLAVTLKIPAADFPDPRQLSALKREFFILGLIKGVGLPKPIDYIELKNSAVLVREWVEGISLREYESIGNISIEKALIIAVQLTRLIGALHRQNFCHRDISPGNVLINLKTSDVTLIDFCSSLEFPNRSRYIIKPTFIEGSRPYMSPEQTGRMNRGLDFRTDFYSLGVLLYELFTKLLPFTTKDDNALIHSHIAIEPVFPSHIAPKLPPIIANIIMKLMNKSPDLRYQSAQGVQADLERCLTQWRDINKIDEFELATNDLHDWFIIPDKLYGREQETGQLVGIFDQVSHGHGHLVFVAGHSGIGKTSLIRELYRPLTLKGGYIASGKYDQVLRHQPYSAILQALTSLIRQIMGEDQDKIAFWKEHVLAGVGVNGQVLIDVIPELELLIGPQPECQPLSTEAASARFNSTFFNLIYELGHAEQPLVFFIDDLQWIDPPSLSLLEAIAPTLVGSTLLIISAYRSNEVLETHPLMIAMPSLAQSCHNMVTIELEELSSKALMAMLKDTIELPEQEIISLVQLLHDKSKGNPLVFKTMLTTLYHQKNIYYDYDSHGWQWIRKGVESLPRTENSAKMLQADMAYLPKNTTELLKLAGCIGNTFSLDLLTSLADNPRSAVARALIPAVSKGFIQPMDDDFELLSSENGSQLPDVNFRFVHDRIQQAAYSMLTPSQQMQLHWSIGWQLLSQIGGSTLEDKLFDAVEHLNQGCSSGIEHSRLMQLVKLNLKAGKRAKQSAAYSVSYSCLQHAQKQLQWLGLAADADIMISVELELAQACYLVAEFEQAEALYSVLRNKITSSTGKLHLCNIQAKQYHHQGLYLKSVEYEYEALRLLGIDLPTDDSALLEIFAQEKAKIELLLLQKDPERLYQQKNVVDPDFTLVHELLFDLFTDSYLLGRGALLAAAAAISTRLSMEQGNCLATSAGFINYATILCSSGEYKEGHKIGRLAVRLADKYKNPTFQNYTYHVFSLGINHWLEPLKSSYHYWHEASKLSMESGSPYAGWVFLQKPHLLLASGAQLKEVEAQVKESKQYLAANRLNDIAQLLNIIVEQPVRHLKGETTDFYSLDDPSFSTAGLLDVYQDAPFFLGHTLYSMLRASLLARSIQPADKLTLWLPIIESTVQAQIIQVDSCLYTALHLSAGCTELTGTARDEQLGLIRQQLSKFETWGELCPANFRHKYLMLKAEWLRLHDDIMGAFDHYELAREAALNARFLMDAALTDELAGLFWRAVGKAYQSRSYLKRAIAGYEQWGARGKVLAMKAQFPELVTARHLDSSTINVTLDAMLAAEDFSAALDMGSVVKASQAISQHIHMEKLAEELLSLAVENACATRGVLLLERNGEFLVSHTILSESSSNDTTALHLPYSESQELSHSIVRYVINAKCSVIYTPNNRDEHFDRCPYLMARDDISVLCVPIVRQKQLSGVLYLENSHTTQAFQLERVHTLQIIASQAAISLENAKMYHDLELLNKNLEDLVSERTTKLCEANEQLTQKNKELYALSVTDQLTGIYNRRYIEDQIQLMLTRREKREEPASILMLDVDYFKTVNDTYGHDVGDKVLVNLAAAIQRSVRNVDVAGRWGEKSSLCSANVTLKAQWPVQLS